jgi:hypothetical protein
MREADRLITVLMPNLGEGLGGLTAGSAAT